MIGSFKKEKKKKKRKKKKKKRKKKKKKKKKLTHVIQSNDELDCWLDGKPKNELKNHFLTNDFLKINEHVQQTTILIANKTAYVENWITFEILSFSPYKLT